MNSIQWISFIFKHCLPLKLFLEKPLFEINNVYKSYYYL